jgi:superfamily II DNA or RNA helicase
MINDNQIIATDSVWTQVGKDLVPHISPVLTYTDTYWQQGRFKKEQVEYEVCMVQYFRKSKEFWIYTGHLPRAIEELKRLKIPHSFTTKIKGIEFDKPHIDGITFRKDQDKILDTAISQGRGVIVSATGTGKSILIRGLIGAFSQEKVLFLVHTKDLVQQMMDDMSGEVDSIGEWSGKKKEKKRVMVATIQSFHKVVKDFVHYFDVVFVDEAHHAHDTTKTYGKTLTMLAAPAKFGLTATLPATDKGKMNLEALIGPVIAHFSIQEAIKQKILSKPIIKIIKVPDVPGFSLFDTSTLPIPEGKEKDPDYKPTKYRTVYWNGLVTNITRNMIIIDLAEEFMKKKQTVLISVVNLEHGEELCDVAEDYYDMKYGVDFVFINGSTPKDERIKIKKDFKSGKLLMVIATTVWNEGVDVPSLNCCILASAGKGRIGVIQKIGRGLRKTKKKDEVTIYDFQDTCHNYLRDQFAARYEIYKNNGWL